MKHLIKRAVRKLGFEITRYRPEKFRYTNPDISDFEWNTWMEVQPFTLTSIESVIALIRATEYVLARNIPGDLVECGVWRGGSALAIGRTLMRRGNASKRLFLYDTFTGMTPPTGDDVDAWGEAACATMQGTVRRPLQRDVWAYAPLEEAKRTVALSGLADGRLRFIQGPVEKTIPCPETPPSIALLRLDTDFYESTRHELMHLYPRLSRGGILIVDDYGHWRGSRKATDEYFGARSPFLHRVDYTCRMAIKMDD